MSKPIDNRHNHFKNVLAKAAAGSSSDYGGLGHFWDLPLEKLLVASLHGVRLIAPEAERKSCCSTTPATSAPRSARSGLIQGLQGLAPFDGTRFPRLPWSGTAVSDEDIQIIAGWIDDGCPSSEPDKAEIKVAFPKCEVSIGSVQLDPAQHPVTPGDANEYLYQRGELKQRMNLDCMTPLQLEKFRYAMRELYKLNKWPEDARSYNNLALYHQNHCQHGWERFLPWHRVYLYEFEQALQDHCPDVTMPYWDWTMAAYTPETPEKGQIIPSSFKAFLTKESIIFLKNREVPKQALEELAGLVNQLFTSLTTFYAALSDDVRKILSMPAHRQAVIDALLAANSLWYPLRYPAEYTDSKTHKPSTINKVIHYHYPTSDDMAQILSLRTFREFGGGSSYDDAFGFIDQNPHNTMHIWTGGMNPNPDNSSAPEADRNKAVKLAGRRFHSRSDLYSQPPFGDMFSNLTAAYDPIFWPIHANIDRVWWEWQQLHPNSNPVELDAVLTPWSYTSGDTLDMHRFGYEYVKATTLEPTNVTAPVSRFVSKEIDISKLRNLRFDRAEVRLHRVPQLPRSCFIRVFLNVPEADGNTPLDHAGYAGYLSVFGHGECYGGPGHCDPPPARARKYDLRPRNHNTPRNHRVNVTKTVRRLIETGASSLQITLVVIGVDYQEDHELLRLEGVSLNFLD